MLGIDPGPKACGWAIVDCRPAGRHRVLHKGEQESGRPFVFAMPIELVAIECPTDFYPVGSKARVIAQAREIARTINVARDIEQSVERLPVVKLTCKQARKSVCGGSNATDRDVSYWLALLCEMPKRSNNHERDAVVIAIAGWRKWSADQLATQSAGAQAVLSAVEKAMPPSAA